MKKRILITGAAGFVGSNLVRYLLRSKKCYSIVGVDRIDNNKNIHNMYSNKSSEFYIADISDDKIIKRILEISRPDVVINLINNVPDVYKFLNSVKEYKEQFNDLKFIQLSNSSVYQDYEDLYELFETKANSLKEVNFICNESIVSNYCNCYNINYNIIRADSCFGPRQNDNIILNIYDGVKQNNKVILRNKGDVKRNLIYIEDLSSSFNTIIEKGQDNQIYNVSSGADFTDLEICFFIKEKMGSNCPVEYLNDTKNDLFYILNTDKIRKLGWKPKLPFKNRIFQTIEWFENNSWYFR